MEALISQFTFLSNQACHDKNFDPYAIEDLMKLFEIEAYNSWAAMELEQEKEVEEAEISMQKAEDYLDDSVMVMESAMDEFRRFEEEEYNGLVESSEKAKKMGKLMEGGSTFASNKYNEEAAINSASASASVAMKAAFKGVSSNRVHPS